MDHVIHYPQPPLQRPMNLWPGHRAFSVKAAIIVAGHASSRPQDRMYVDFNSTTIDFFLPTHAQVPDRSVVLPYAMVYMPHMLFAPHAPHTA